MNMSRIADLGGESLETCDSLDSQASLNLSNSEFPGPSRTVRVGSCGTEQSDTGTVSMKGERVVPSKTPQIFGWRTLRKRSKGATKSCVLERSSSSVHLN